MGSIPGLGRGKLRLICGSEALKSNKNANLAIEAETIIPMTIGGPTNRQWCVSLDHERRIMFQ